MKDKKLLDLVRRASKQNKDAFNELCNLKAREIIYLCTIEMGNQHDGEDAAQEVFIRMQKNIAGLKAPEAFNVWLNRLVHNTCVNMKRDTMKHKNSIPFETFEDAEWQDDSLFSLPQAFMEDAENRAMVAEAVESLPEKYRNCVVLHYYQNLSYAQIAEVLDISTDAVNNNMRMARKHLRLELEEQMAPQPTAAWAAVPLVASGPVLALSLQESALACATPEVIAGCLSAAGVPAVKAAGLVGKSAVQNVLKVLAPVVATGAVAAAVLQFVQGDAPPEPAPASPGPAVSASMPADPADAAILPAEDADEAITEVSGTVSGAYGAETGVLAGVQVALEGPGGTFSQVVTGADGGFAFEAVPHGSYQLRLTLPGSGHTTCVALGEGEQFTISEKNAGGFAGLDIVLALDSRLGGTLALRLDSRLLAYKEEYLPGVRVVLLDPQGEAVAEAPVHGDGTYCFENPPIYAQGTFVLRVLVDEVALGEDLEIQDTEVELYPGYKN